MAVSNPMLRAAHHSAGLRGRLIEAHRLLRADPGAGTKLIAARRAGDPSTGKVATVARILGQWVMLPLIDTTAALYRQIALRAGCSDATVASCIKFIVRVLGGGKDADT